MPAALTTCSVSIGSPSASTARTSRPAPSTIPVDADPAPDVDAERPRRIRHSVGRDVRIDMAVAGHPDGAEDRGAVGFREPLEHLGRRDELGLEPDAGGSARGPAQVEQALLARRDAHAADALEDAELAVHLDAVAPEAHHRRRRVELGHEPRGVVGRPARQLSLLEQHDLAPPGLGEVVARRCTPRSRPRSRPPWLAPYRGSSLACRWARRSTRCWTWFPSLPVAARSPSCRAG